MDRSTKTPTAWLLWPSTLLMIAAAPVYANDDDGKGQPSTSSTPIAFSMDNPCYRDPATRQRGHEQVSGNGTQRTTVRQDTKRDGSSEFRQFDRTDGSGFGDLSGAKYVVAEDHQLNIRSKGNFQKRTERTRQMGNPQKALVAIDTGARAFVVTVEEEITFNPPRPTRVETSTDTNCKDQRGRDKRDDED
jgi:hypothetical protein